MAMITSGLESEENVWNIPFAAINPRTPQRAIREV